jgi:hypothetical protein
MGVLVVVTGAVVVVVVAGAVVVVARWCLWITSVEDVVSGTAVVEVDVDVLCIRTDVDVFVLDGVLVPHAARAPAENTRMARDVGARRIPGGTYKGCPRIKSGCGAGGGLSRRCPCRVARLGGHPAVT